MAVENSDTRFSFVKMVDEKLDQPVIGFAVPGRGAN